MTLTSRIFRNRPVLVSRQGTSAAMPAELTRPVKGPNSASLHAIARLTPSSSVTSSFSKCTLSSLPPRCGGPDRDCPGQGQPRRHAIPHRAGRAQWRAQSRSHRPSRRPCCSPACHSPWNRLESESAASAASVIGDGPPRNACRYSSPDRALVGSSSGKQPAPGAFPPDLDYTRPLQSRLRNFAQRMCTFADCLHARSTHRHHHHRRHPLDLHRIPLESSRQNSHGRGDHRPKPISAPQLRIGTREGKEKTHG